MHLLIAAAGSGSRMGADCNKLLLKIAGKSVVNWTLDSVILATSITWIGIIGQPSDKKFIMPLVNGWTKPVHWIDGGNTRQESVERGLDALPKDAKYVLIHDGARCLVEPELFNKCAEMTRKGIAVIAATPVIDTIKKVDNAGYITETPDRSLLWAAQTPQGFSVEDLKQGHQKAIENNWNVTDDASLFEKLGWPVKILESLPSNIKVTTPFDLLIAESMLVKRIQT